MDLIDLVYDNEYHCKVNQEICSLSWDQALKEYKEKEIERCIAPNSEFAAYDEILYYESSDKKCKLGEWLQEPTKEVYNNLLSPALYSVGDKESQVTKAKLLKTNLSRLANLNFKDTESLLGKTTSIVIEQYVLNSLSNADYIHELQSSSMIHIEKGLQKKFNEIKCQKNRCNAELKLLSNQIVGYQGDVYEHSDFLLNLAGDKELAEVAKQVVIECLTKEALTKAAYKTVDIHLREQFVKYKCSDRICDIDTVVLTHYIDHYSKDKGDINELVKLVSSKEFSEEARNVVFNKIGEDIEIIAHEKLDKFRDLLEVDQKGILSKAFIEAYRKQGYVLNVRYVKHIIGYLDNEEYRSDAVKIISASIENEIKDLSGEIEFSVMEEYLDKVLDSISGKSAELPMSLLETILEYYNKDQSYFIRHIIKIVAENKLIPREVLEKIKEILLKVPEKHSQIFIARRLNDYHVFLEDDQYKYMSGLLEEESTRVAAINYWGKAFEKLIDPKIQEEIADKLIISVKTKAEFNKLVNLKGFTQERLNLVKAILNDDIEKIKAAAENISNREIIILYLEDLLSSQNEKALQLFQELKVILEGRSFWNFFSPMEVELSKKAQELVDLKDRAESSEGISSDAKKIQIGTSKFILKKEQYDELISELNSLGKLANYVYKLAYKTIADVFNIIDFIKNSGVTSGDLNGIINKAIDDKDFYKLLCSQLLDKLNEDKNISSSDNKVIKRSYNILMDKLHWEAKSLYFIVKSIDSFLVQKLANYGVSPCDVNRAGEEVKTIFYKKEQSEWLKEVNKAIVDKRFFIPKTEEVIFTEFGELNEELNKNANDLIDKGYFKDQIARWKKYTKDCEEETRECPFEKRIGLWEEEDYVAWVAGLSGITDDNMPEVLYIISGTVQAKLNMYPRDVQVIAVLSLYKSDNGILAQIGTGEGKSLIIAMFAVMKILEDKLYRRQVDIITSSRELAIRDVEEYKEFYETFGITVSHNIKEGDGYRKNCYLADIVYGDTMNFIGDTLRDIRKNTKYGRGFDILIVDEVDNLFIDQSNMKIQLTSSIVGMEMLGKILANIWGEGISFIGRIDQEKDGCYYNIPNLNEEDISELEELSILKDSNISEEDIRKAIESKRLHIGDSCEEKLMQGIESYIPKLLNYNQTDRAQRAIVVPSHLEEFALEQITNWGKSFKNAISSEKNNQYVVMAAPAEDSDKYKVAAPVDSEKTGVIQFKLQQSDGLQQFLQLKHRLTLTAENIITTFMSFYGYFSKYSGNIYGVTGTLGDEADQSYLRDVYGVELLKLPTFIEKDLIEYESVIVGVEKEWREEIVETVKREVVGGRAVLIVIEKIQDVQDIYRTLKNQYSHDQVYIYSKGGEEEKSTISRELKAGDVIVASNLAGRGTDFKLSPEVIKNGGLHIIVGVFPNHVRVEYQAYGRVARQSDPGSSQMILNSEDTNIYLIYSDCKNDIKCLEKARTESEYLSLIEDKLCRLPMLELRDGMFSLFTEELRGVDSPTRYPIIIGEPNGNSGIFIYLKENKVFIKVTKIENDNISEKEFNEEYLKGIDEKATKHMKTVLSNSKNKKASLNKQDFELINFVVAEKGFTEIDIIIKRVNYKFNKEVERSNSECIAKNKEEHGRNHHDSYLYCLHEAKDDYKDIEGEDHELLKKVELRRKFELWLEDREKYNTIREQDQATEYFGMWLKNNTNKFYLSCNIRLKEELVGNLSERIEFNQTAIDIKINDIREELQIGFSNFSKELELRKGEGKLFKNPNVLVLKAWDLMRLESSEKDVRDHFSGESISGGILVSIWKWGTSTINSIVGFGKRMLFGDEIYNPSSPIDISMVCLSNATELEPHYAWTAYNALSYGKMIKNGTDLVKLTKENANKAAKIKREFFRDVQKSIERINNTVIPVYEGKLVYLASKNLINYDDEIAIQLIGTIKVYEQVMETLQKNMEFIKKLSGKEMIRMGRHIPIEEATSKAKGYTVGNITEIIEKQQDEADAYTIGNITDKLTEQLGREYNNIQYKDKSLKNTTKEIEFLSYNYTINQITLAGGFLFELDSYELIEKKNWWGTIFAAVIGVISIYTGLWVLGTWGLAAGAAGTVFATAFGASLVLQGVGDILGSLISVATGNPINFGDFINSKGMAIGVALATAGTLHFLSGIKVIDAALKITEKMSDLQALYNVGKGAFVLGAIGTQAALAGTSALVYNTLKHTVDSDDIEQDAKEAANKLLKDKREALKKIFATDQFFEDVGDQSRRGYLENLLDEEVTEITGNYLGRFHGDKETFGMDYAVGMAGHAAGGISPDGVFGWANVISTGAKALQGTVKSSEAIGKITSKVRSAIDRIADMALPPSDIMLFNLQKARGGATDDEADSLKYALERQGFIRDGNIKVSCEGDNGIGSVQVASNLASYKNMLVSACISTKKLMSVSFEDKFNELKSKLISQITDTKTNIQKHEVVKPVAQGISTPLVEKMKESSFYKRLFNGIADKMGVHVPSEAEIKLEAINIARAHGVLHSALKQHAIAEGKQEDDIAVDRNPINSQKAIDDSKIKNNPKIISIEEGKTLSDYAAMYGVSEDELVHLNNIKNRNLIKTGHDLKIPENARYPDGDNPSYVNNQKSSVLQPWR